MAVDPEYFLDHDQAATGLALRFRQVAREFMVVERLDIYGLAHCCTPFLVCAKIQF